MRAATNHGFSGGSGQPGILTSALAAEKPPFVDCGGDAKNNAGEAVKPSALSAAPAPKLPPRTAIQSRTHAVTFGIQFFTDLELVAVLAIVAVLSFVIGAGMRFVFMAPTVGQ